MSDTSSDSSSERTKMCYLTVGVSASGKTTWAEGFVSEKAAEGKQWININRDDIRRIIIKEKHPLASVSLSMWRRKWEKECTARWKSFIEKCIMLSPDGIIISDTNLNKKTRDWLIETFTNAGYTVELKMFQVDYDVAVKRDVKRNDPVGAFVIAEQMQKYWEQFHKRYEPDTSLDKAVIVDLDGTLAHMTDRSPYEWDRVCEDAVDEIIRDIITGMKDKGYKIIILSGRDGSCEEYTIQWIQNNLDFVPDVFVMRAAGDMRGDTIVKEEMFWKHIAHKYNVVLAIDDRPQVVLNTWTALGIKTLATGNQSIHF